MDASDSERYEEMEGQTDDEGAEEDKNSENDQDLFLKEEESQILLDEEEEEKNRNDEALSIGVKSLSVVTRQVEKCCVCLRACINGVVYFKSREKALYVWEEHAWRRNSFKQKRLNVFLYEKRWSESGSYAVIACA